MAGLYDVQTYKRELHCKESLNKSLNLESSAILIVNC